MAGIDAEPRMNSGTFEFDFEPGWVDLTLEECDWVGAWAVATVMASTQFDPGKLKVRTRALIRDLRRRALARNSGGVNSADACYTPEGGRRLPRQLGWTT